MDRIKPQSPDPYIIKDEDMYLIRLGHFNALVDAVNSVIPSGTGLMYQSQYDPTNSGIVNNSYLLASQSPAYYLSLANHTGVLSQASITNLTTDLSLKGDMFKVVYDTNNTGVVDNSERLNGQLAAFYLNRANQTGSIAQSDVVGLVGDLALKEDKSQKGAANGYAPLVGGLVPLVNLPPGTPNLYKGLYDASTNTPAIINGTGVAGEFYIANITGNAYAPVNVTLVNQIVAYSGAVWEVGAVFTGGISDVNGQLGPTVTLDADDIAETATRFYINANENAALANSTYALTAINPVASNQDISLLTAAVALKGDMFKATYDTNNDGIVNNSDLLSGQLPTYYRDRANHIGVQSQATITNLIADLAAKIPFSEKGVANGVCDLDVNGKVPLSRLNLSAFNYAGLWNAFTNSPALADGTGAISTLYIVNVAGVRNLGSGAVSYNIGDQLVYNGSIWQKIAATAGGIISINGITTPVMTLTSDDITEGSTNFYQTVDQEGAANAAEIAGANAANRYVIQSDLTSLITVGTGFFGAELFADGQTLGDGSIRVLNTLGYTNGTAAVAWPRVNSAYTINVAQMDIDWIAHQEAMLTMEQQGYSSFTTPGGRCYCTYDSIYLPKTLDAVPAAKRSQMIGFNFNYSKYNNLSGNSFSQFLRMPVDQIQANGSWLNYQFLFEKGSYDGNFTASADDCFIKLGATNSSVFRDLNIRNIGIGVDAQFALQAQMQNINVVAYGLYGLTVRDGLWSGAAADNAQSNNATFDNIHFSMWVGKTPTAALYCSGNRNLIVNTIGCEGEPGPNSVHHILYDQRFNGGPAFAQTVKNAITVTNFDMESAGCSRSAFNIIGSNIRAKLSGFFSQLSDVDIPVMVETTNLGSANYIFVEDATTWASANPKSRFRDIGGSGDSKWIVTDCALNNMSDLRNASNWDVTLGGVIPPLANIRFTPVVGW